MIDVYDTVFPVKLANRRFTSPRFTELKDEGREPPTAPTAQELLAVTKLRDRAARTLATAVKASGGLLLKDAPKQLPQDHRADVEHLTTELKASGIIDSEVFVVCSKTQAQVARVPNLQVIDDLARSGVKCACGRSISEERHEEALTVTELGRSLLDKARWLTVLLIQELEGMGVPAGDILVEQNIGGDEIDCLANISGELVLIELKDKEFSLGNAYSFGAKIAIVRPQHKVIITTDKIGNDAKEHFKRARLSGGTEGDMDFLYEHSQQGRDITYIEGVQNLNEGLADLVTSIYRGDATRLLGQVLPFAVVDGAALLAAFESTIAQPKTVAA
ncbi:hypothetical protein [Sinimarinibacterium flocculans]|uniref:hypothetical protein n=1 Tax=Sinimarinibacterium flocculans TaxID=985250 RepID=UPI0036D267D3